MKGKTNRYYHYSNRKAIIASLSGVEGFFACTSCINNCVRYVKHKRTWMCPRYKPVKIRKTTMRKLLKRRRTEK